MSNLTRESAIALAESGFWKELSHREIAGFQLFEDKLCMPFEVYHEAVEKALGRPVFTHEFGLNRSGLQAELLGDKPRPSLSEVLGLIPADKRMLVVLEGES